MISPFLHKQNKIKSCKYCRPQRIERLEDVDQMTIFESKKNRKEKLLAENRISSISIVLFGSQF